MAKKILFIVTLAFLSITAYAQEPAPPPGEQHPVAEAYAEAYGVPLGEAISRLAKMDQAAELEERLLAQHPNRFGGLYVEHRPEFRIVVKATGDAEQLLRETVNDPAFVPRPAERSLRGLRQAQENVLEVLERLGLEFESSLDVATGEVKVFVLDASKARPAVEALLTRHPFITLQEVEAMPVPSATILGGLRASGSTLNCTTGFNVRNSAGTRGVMTAGHCNDTITVVGISLTRQAERYTGSYDLQWNTRSGHSYPNRAQIGEPYLYDILRTNTPAVGMYLCKYGITTGQTCGEVMTTYAYTTEHDGTTGVYVRMRDTLGGAKMNDFGDSGGPVFGEAGTAYGIVHAKGQAGSAYEKDMYFMPVSRTSVLGITVLTSP